MIGRETFISDCNQLTRLQINNTFLSALINIFNYLTVLDMFTSRELSHTSIHIPTSLMLCARGMYNNVLCNGPKEALTTIQTQKGYKQ